MSKNNSPKRKLIYKASTGGSDLLSYVIRAYKPQYRTSNLILMTDTIIITVNDLRSILFKCFFILIPSFS